MENLQDRAAFQLTSRPGFVFKGQEFEGFEDRPDLPLVVRAQIARWAVMNGTPSALQQDLAKLPPVEPSRHEVLQLLAEEQAFLGTEDFTVALSLLTSRQRDRLMRPHAFLTRAFVWPMSIGDASRVLETISEHQLRDWDDQGLVPARRWGEGNYRGYFRRDLMLAWMVDSLLKGGWTVAALRQRLGLDPLPAQVEMLHRVRSFSSQPAENVVASEPELALR
jgi:DNA-binding transcriptional MerR regulator